jgi:hypothetical protein
MEAWDVTLAMKRNPKTPHPPPPRKRPLGGSIRKLLLPGGSGARGAVWARVSGIWHRTDLPGTGRFRFRRGHKVA